VPAGHVGQHLQRGQFLLGLQRTELFFPRRSLVPQLDDVHPAGQRGIGELGEVTAVAAGVGAQIQGRRLQTVMGLGHVSTVATSVDAATLGWP
jgi:hypothetical protein